MSILGPNQPPEEKPEQEPTPVRQSPAERFRSIAAASKSEPITLPEAPTPVEPKPEVPKRLSLPRLGATSRRSALPRKKATPPDPSAPSLREKILHPDKEKVRAAYWNVTGTISLVINAVLIAALIILSRMVFQLGQMVNEEILFKGLYMNFGKMDTASIKTTIQVNQTIPINFPLTINQPTMVTLTEDTVISNATVYIDTLLFDITNAPARITLPAGTQLPIQLNMVVPVQANIPIGLTVPVDIPLKQTELHEPFSNLQTTLEPVISMIFQRTDWEKMGFCKAFHGICSWWFYP